jgi:hypothetical protein
MSSTAPSLEACYNDIVITLELMAVDKRRLDSRPYDAIFIHDMLIRLKLWAADIRLEDGTLQWAGQLEPISDTLHDLLRSVKEQSQLFHIESLQAIIAGTGTGGKYSCRHHMVINDTVILILLTRCQNI